MDIIDVFSSFNASSFFYLTFSNIASVSLIFLSGLFLFDFLKLYPILFNKFATELLPINLD